MAIRGGNWNNASSTGLAALNLNDHRSNSNSNIGFRLALIYCLMQTAYIAACSCIFKRSIIPSYFGKYIVVLFRLVSSCWTSTRGPYA